MKYFIFSLLLLIASQQLYAQKVGSTILKQNGTSAYCYENEPYYLDSIFNYQGKSKKELFELYKTFLLQNTKKDNLLFEDSSMNQLVVRYIMDLNPIKGVINSGYVVAKYNILFKDEKVKIKINDFVFVSPDGITGLYKNPLHILQGFNNKYKKIVFKEFDATFQKTLKQFENIADSYDSKW